MLTADQASTRALPSTLLSHTYAHINTYVIRYYYIIIIVITAPTINMPKNIKCNNTNEKIGLNQLEIW